MEKILVVEDNRALSAILRQRLEKDGFSVDVIEGGLALLAHLKNGEEPDAVILDLFIPEKSGLELLDALVNKWKKVRIFIYTAQVQWKSTCLRHPAVCRFFSKSDDAQDIIEAIKRELRSGQDDN